MDGIILINKTHGKTSRDVVDAVEKKFQIKKVGHTGTLDPFATGLLVITLGKGTKAGPYLEALDKTYVATLKLGTKTDTGDLTGTVIETKELPPFNGGDVLKALTSFLGDSTQIPPMYSALKKDGVPLYKLARQGETVEREPRKVHISNIKLKNLTADEITFEVRCSKGTYVRTLGEDIAEKLGTVGHLTALTRTAVGKFLLDDAHTLEYVTPSSIISVRDALDFMEKVIVKGDDIKKIMDGKPFNFLKGNRLLVLDDKNQVLAVYERDETGVYKSLRGLF